MDGVKASRLAELGGCFVAFLASVTISRTSLGELSSKIMKSMHAHCQRSGEGKVVL
jgi:hypothetical protein